MKRPNTSYYWDGAGKYHQYVGDLEKLIPVMGLIPDPKNNPKLELFRRASNVYYDVYNNGLGNRGRDFYPVFRFRSSDYRLRDYEFQSHFYDVLEEAMDKIILEAAIEQGLTSPASVVQSVPAVQQL